MDAHPSILNPIINEVTVDPILAPKITPTDCAIKINHCNTDKSNCNDRNSCTALN